MRIIIVGGTHFIGPHIVELLHQNGHEVILFNRGETHYPFSFPVISIQGDRADLVSYKEKLLALTPDVVIDMIAYSESDAKQLVNTFRGKVNRLVVLSSCDVYRAYDRLWKVFDDNIMPMPLTESADLRANLFPFKKMAAGINDWKYSYEKILVERTLLNCTETDSTILRLPMVYGPGDFSRIYPYLKRMDDHRPILLDEKKAEWRFSRGYVKDIANAIVLAALDNRPGNRVYNVAETNALSELEWIQHIAKIADWENKIIFLPQEKLPVHLQEPIAWEQDLVIDSNLIRKELNYQESFLPETAMKVTVDWLRNNEPKEKETIHHYSLEDETIHHFSAAQQERRPNV